MNGKLDRFIAGERGSNAWIGYAAFVVIVILSVLAIVCLAGCAAIEASKIEKLDDIFWQWVERQSEKPPSVEKPADAPVDTPAADTGDEVAFGALQWRYGDFNGGSAARDPNVQISALTMHNGNRLYYRWDKGLSAWGMAHSDHSGAICAAFFEINGAWVGGKFDWVSTSRSDRELKHVESYKNWTSSGIRLPWRGRVAFVVVDKAGKRRSNVLVTK